MRLAISILVNLPLLEDTQKILNSIMSLKKEQGLNGRNIQARPFIDGWPGHSFLPI
jgi:hypothetical protein